MGVYILKRHCGRGKTGGIEEFRVLRFSHVFVCMLFEPCPERAKRKKDKMERKKRDCGGLIVRKVRKAEGGLMGLSVVHPMCLMVD